MGSRGGEWGGVGGAPGEAGGGAHGHLATWTFHHSDVESCEGKHLVIGGKFMEGESLEWLAGGQGGVWRARKEAGGLGGQGQAGVVTTRVEWRELWAQAVASTHMLPSTALHTVATYENAFW